MDRTRGTAAAKELSPKMHTDQHTNYDNNFLGQNWINNPAANQGVLLVMPVAGKGTQMYSSETGTASLRPKLTITYKLP